MPIVPLLAIAGAAVAGTVAGVGIAAAGITAITAFEVVAAVGATIGAIGVVSRDKTLSTVGLAIGAIGGIGGLASSAGLLGSAAASDAPLFGAAPAASTADSAGSAFGGAASDASSAATYGPTSAFATGDAAGATAAATEAGTGLAAPLATANTGSDGMVNFVAGLDQAPPADGLTTLQSTTENAANPAALPGPRADGTGLSTAPAPASDLQTSFDQAAAGTPLATGSPTAPPTGLPNLNGAPSVPGITGVGNSAAPPLNPSTGAVDSGNFGSPNTDPNFQAGDSAGQAAAFNSAQYTGSGSSIFGKIADFANKSPVATLGTLQAAGSLLSGATSTLTPAQVAYYNANAANNQAAANLATQQQRNLAMPKATASLAPVTGVPNPLVPPTANPLAPQVQLPGLMNNVPPPRLAPVTGTVT